MKHLLSTLLIVVCLASAAIAQKREHKTEDKIRVHRTATVGMRVHNVFHPKHKHYSGYKVRHNVTYKKM